MKRWIHAATEQHFHSTLDTLAFCKDIELGDEADTSRINRVSSYAFALNLASLDDASEVFDVPAKYVKFIPITVSKQGIAVSKSDYLVPTDILAELELPGDIHRMLEIGADAFNDLFAETGIIKIWAPNFTTGSKNGYSLGIPSTSRFPKFAKKYILADLLEDNKHVLDMLNQNGYKLVWPESNSVYITFA